MSSYSESQVYAFIQENHEYMFGEPVPAGHFPLSPYSEGFMRPISGDTSEVPIALSLRADFQRGYESSGNLMGFFGAVGEYAVSQLKREGTS